MLENLHRGLDQLGSMQIEHKNGHGKPLDCFKHVLQYLVLSIPVHGFVIQVNDYGQGTVIQPAA